MDSINYEISSSDYKRENIFLSKNWISTIDLNNANYATNQLIIDSSALSNSSKMLNYREGLVVLPMILTLTCTTNAAGFAPATTATSLDYCLGLKSFFGSIVHSQSLELNGSSIIQTTPFNSMYQNLCLLTELSWGDISVLGPIRVWHWLIALPRPQCTELVFVITRIYPQRGEPFLGLGILMKPLTKDFINANNTEILTVTHSLI